MELITYLAVYYVLFGLIFSLVVWFSATQYEAPNWKGRQRAPWELLFLLIFIWPILIIGAGKQDIGQIVPFYRNHPKLLFSIVSIITSIFVIIGALLSIAA